MTLNVEKLYKEFGDTLEYTYIDNPDEGCFDLINDFAEIVAMNGDEVEVLEIVKGAVILITVSGEPFMLTTMEFNVGVNREDITVNMRPPVPAELAAALKELATA